MKLRIIDADAVGRLIELPEIIEAVAEIFASFGRGEVTMPPKIYLDLPGGDLRAMPAAIPGLAGIKWVNSHAGNAARGLPAVMAMILINEPETGRPLALLDGTLITRLRTGAAAAVATRTLARKDAATVGVIGCGGQSLPMLRAIAHVMTIGELRRADRDPARAEALARALPELPVRIVEAREAAGADVLCTVTPSRAPIVADEWIGEGTHINAMGADAAGKQELDPAILRRARVFVDDWEQAAHSGEINVPLGLGEIEGVAGSICDVLAGKAEGRRSREEVTVFDSTGLAIQDLAVALRVWQRAQERDEGHVIDFAMGVE